MRQRTSAGGRAHCAVWHGRQWLRGPNWNGRRPAPSGGCQPPRLACPVPASPLLLQGARHTPPWPRAPRRAGPRRACRTRHRNCAVNRRYNISCEFDATPLPPPSGGGLRLSLSLSAPERGKRLPLPPPCRRGSIASPCPSPIRRGKKRLPLPPPSGGGIAPPPKMPPSAPEGGYLQPLRVPLPVSLDNTRAAVTKGARRWRRRNP